MHRMNRAPADVPYVRLVNFTPPPTAFCNDCVPGFSTYPQPGALEQWQKELSKHGNPGWASCEGTAIEPDVAAAGDKPMNMERYLGNLFNHGAVLVNVFGWGIGDKANGFRKTAESDEAIAAYSKFISGQKLDEAPIPIPAIPPMGLKEKMRTLQATLPQWIEEHGPAQVKDNMENLQALLNEKKFDEASPVADAILKTIRN
jgi:hypothetical protein